MYWVLQKTHIRQGFCLKGVGTKSEWHRVLTHTPSQWLMTTSARGFCFDSSVCSMFSVFSLQRNHQVNPVTTECHGRSQWSGAQQMRKIRKSQQSMSHLQSAKGNKEEGYWKVFTVLGDLSLEDSLVMVIISYLLWGHQLQLLHEMHTWHDFHTFQRFQHLVNVYIMYTNETLALRYVDHLKKEPQGNWYNSAYERKTRQHNKSVYLSMKKAPFHSWSNYFMVVEYHPEAASMEHKYNPCDLHWLHSFHWAPEDVESMNRWLSPPAGYRQERAKVGLQKANIGNEFFLLQVHAQQRTIVSSKYYQCWLKDVEAGMAEGTMGLSVIPK